LAEAQKYKQNSLKKPFFKACEKEKSPVALQPAGDLIN